ncbi:LysR family transcriptional regulator [Achromobacter sp. GG226]|uniref:LysR family transcriptional regulator n=1 Tax=Verticiella alkaliphila TaxID=2779529 RepID=UPI001C0C5507|nr:LysR family transcriptional regulator [Verticiella sp. GG226]MBU4612687.1 LysR family transcriptional regulator [Verticiella sp. GG226]
MSVTLEIDLLRTFQAVARLGQFRAAAEQIHRSPAAVSVQIQRLEAVVGGRLFERDNQSVSLTPTGERLISHADELLRRHDAMLGELQGRRQAGRIKFGVPDEYAQHLIRDILPRFAAHWPEVVLEVITAPSLTLRDKVARRHLHLALTVQPLGEQTAADALAVTTPVWVGARGGEETWGADRAVPGALPLALHASGCCYRDAMLRALDQAGRPWRVVLTSPSSLAVEACVEAGLAVSLIDRSRVTAAMQVLEDLPTIPPHEAVLLHTPQAGPAVERLASMIRRHFHF